MSPNTARPRVSHVLVAALAAGLLPACAIVQSTPDTHATSRQGVVYMLPKALLPVQLVEADNVLMLRMQPAETVGDPAHRYFLAHPANAFASDDVTIDVDPATGLLTKLTATAEDQTLATLTELLKSAGIRRAELGGEGGETVLFSGLYDPDGADAPGSPNDKLRAGLQRALLSRIGEHVAACKPDAVDAGCPAARKLEASLQAALAPGAKPEAAVIVVKATPLPDAAPPPGAPASQAVADCSVGICYRSVRPFVVELEIRGVFAQSTVALLPNGGAPVALALDRAPFVKTEHTVTLSGGRLQSVQTKRPSSALALVKWPLEVYQAVLEATATLIQLRIGANTKEVELAQSQLDTAKELKRIREELDSLKAEGGTPALSGTSIGGPRRGDALLAIEIGARPQLKTGPLPAQPGDPARPGSPGPGVLPGAGAPR